MTTTLASCPRARVIYDGDCPLCRRSVAMLRRLDWFGRLDYVDARDGAEPLLKLPWIAAAPLLEEMHVLTPDGKRLHHGFGALRWLAWRLPLLWIFAPFLYVPGIPSLGQRVYLAIARNRYHLVPCRRGVCDIQQKRPPV